MKKKDAYSPNTVVLSLCLFLVLNILVFGQTLHIPASRIENLYIRSVVISLMDSLSQLSSFTKTDKFLPKITSHYVEITGLSKHPSWDTRFYNIRGTIKENDGYDKNLSIGTSDEYTTQVKATIQEKFLDENLYGENSKAFYNGLERQKSIIHSEDNPLKVFMFGDSQVFSLGSGLSRLVGKQEQVDVDFLAIHSSGFIRWDYYNWPEKLDDYFTNNVCDAAVMMLGMNDIQNFWSSKGEVLKRNSPEWNEAYKQKCKVIIDRVLMSVPHIYWIGMPLVKNQTYNESLEAIDKLHSELAETYSPNLLTRISLKESIPGIDEEYTQFVSTESGKSIRAMTDDGSHFTVEGGQIVMMPLFENLKHSYFFKIVPKANKLE